MLNRFRLCTRTSGTGSTQGPGFAGRGTGRFVNHSIHALCLFAMGVLLVAGSLSLASNAEAQNYPTKPVTMIVPHPPGAATDGIARGVAQGLSKLWGQTIIVENKPGANQILAAEYTARSAPDGYTILVVADAPVAMNQYLYAKLPYNPDKDLMPITRWVEVHSALIVQASLPVSNAKEFVGYMKQNGSKLNYSSPGFGDNSHINMEWFKKVAGFEMLHIPYVGMAAAVQALLTGDAQAVICSIITADQHIKTGKLKPLAISGSVRSSLYPNMQTFTEAGYPNVSSSFLLGLVAPAGTPAPIIAKIAADTKKVLFDPAFRAKYTTPFEYEMGGDGPEEFAAYIKKKQAMWETRIKAAGVERSLN